ncbi:uncharacterized protein LOC126998550 [Eriocheir sinensis]|uniref:uncharacterized protein LOC126998550 n=1 Tax=Eriocheir sinensis TaxID=95602 RepID=UPI0021C744E7|nr:uncharacterized protein LOC126998550 [Eriocheir sinensis]
MKSNHTFRYLSQAQAQYLPQEVNFWTMAIVAVGTGFILTVAVSIYLICQTRLERPLAVRQQRTVRYISHGPDLHLRPHQCPPTNAPHLDDLALTPYHLQDPPQEVAASLH